MDTEEATPTVAQIAANSRRATSTVEEDRTPLSSANLLATRDSSDATRWVEETATAGVPTATPTVALTATTRLPTSTPVPPPPTRTPAPTRTPSPPTATATATPPIILPSGRGGIGNTRADAYDYWNFLPSTRAVGEFSAGGTQDQTFEAGDYNVTFSFVLNSDGRERDTDRLIYITVEWITTFSQSSAEQMRARFLPDDADLSGPSYRNQFGEPIQEYQSAAVAEQFPSLPVVEGFGPPGQIWTSIVSFGSGNGVLEILLYDRWS